MGIASILVRRFVNLSFLAIWCILAASTLAEDRPNILWLTSEDNSFHWLGCYGNDQARTPHIDGLAAQGILYRYAYSNAPVCAVARNTLITGRYACGMGTHNMRSRYPIPEQFRTYVSYLREAGYYCVNRSKTDYNFQTDDKSHWDECSGKAHWKNCPEDQPFFAIFNTGISHESSLFENKIKSARKSGAIPPEPSRDPNAAELPPFMPDTPEIREDYVTYMDIVTAMDRQIGDWLNELKAAGKADNTIVFYYSDHGGILPRAKRYVYDTGTHVPMIVHVPERWAHLAPSKAGSTNDRPVGFIDLPPTLMSLAGIDIPAQFQGRAFLGEAIQEPEPYVYLYGQRFDSRMLRFVRGVTNGKYRYIRNFHPHRHRGILAGYPHGQAGWRSFYSLKQKDALNDSQLAFWRIPQPSEELYDLDADPWEVRNLVGDAEHADVLTTMRSAVVSKMREIKDTGIVPESMYEGISRNGTIYDYVQAEDFAYDQTLELALLASDLDRRDEVEPLVRAMQSEHAVHRYWGVLGCTIRGKAVESVLPEIAKLLQDPSPAVQVVACEALLTLGKRELGLQKTIEVLQQAKDSVVVLEALNMIAAQGLTAQIPKAVYESACDVGSYPKRMLEDYPNE